MANEIDGWHVAKVMELQNAGFLLVEDGNHGEYRPRKEEFGHVGVSFIRAADMNNGRVLFESAQKINANARNRIRKGIGAGGDVLLSHKGTVGKVAYVPLDAPPFVCSPQTTFWRTLNNEKIDRRYLNSYLNSHLFKNQLFSRQNETDMAGYVSLTAQRSLDIILPPIEEQRAIAHILGSLDDKIELNRRMNETLEAMAQAMFKSWFVDFDPVIDNALAAGNEIPETLKEKAAARKSLGDARKPLPEEIRNLFPSEFEYSDEMGWIPKGWEVGPTSELAKLNPRSWTAKNAPQYIHYVDLANTKNGRINLIVPYKFSDAPSRARRILRQNDTIIGTVRPGNRSFAYIHDDNLTGSTGFAVMRPKKNIFRTFIYLNLSRNEVIDYFAHLADGAAYPAIRPEVVVNLNCVLSNIDILEKFDSIIYPWFDSIGKREFQISSLTNLRDTLLPKLLSGEIRIPEKGEV